MDPPHWPPDWLLQARRAASLEPLRAREPLLLQEDAPVVGSIEPAVAEALVAARLPIRRGDVGWVVAAPAQASLAAIARGLHAAGVCRRWRDELLPVRGPAGRASASVERSVVRALGIPTFAAHLVGSAADGRVWVQQRAFDKATDPGAWDTLVGGLVGADETTESALERETMEEAGLALASLDSRAYAGRIEVRRPVADGYMVESIDAWHAVVPGAMQPVNQDGEVERFEALAPAELVRRLARAEFTLEAALILGRMMEQGRIAAGEYDANPGRPSARSGGVD